VRPAVPVRGEQRVVVITFRFPHAHYKLAPMADRHVVVMSGKWLRDSSDLNLLLQEAVEHCGLAESEEALVQSPQAFEEAPLDDIARSKREYAILDRPQFMLHVVPGNQGTQLRLTLVDPRRPGNRRLGMHAEIPVDDRAAPPLQHRMSFNKKKYISRG